MTLAVSLVETKDWVLFATAVAVLLVAIVRWISKMSHLLSAIELLIDLTEWHLGPDHGSPQLFRRIQKIERKLRIDADDDATDTRSERREDRARDEFDVEHPYDPDKAE